MFRYLDGSMTQERRFRQSHITTLSLLLTTIFKACIVGCVGLAFTQHIWHNLRQRTFTIDCIEHLFSLRSNPVELARLKASLEALILFAMAVFVWLVPIAIIYPPSALTVEIRPFLVMKVISVPVLFPFDPDFDPLEHEKSDNPRPYRNEWMPRPPDSLHINYLWPNSSLARLAESVLISGKIAEFPPLENENASYILNFRSPQISCTNETIIWTETQDMVRIYNNEISPYSIVWTSEMASANLTITSLTKLLWYPGSRPWLLNESFAFEGHKYILVCKPVSVAYALNVSYKKGFRELNYTKRDSRPLQPIQGRTFSYNKTTSEDDSRSTTYLDDKQQWVSRIQETLWTWTEWSILTATLGTLNFYCDTATPRGLGYGDVDFTLPNGTTTDGVGVTSYRCNTSTSSLLARSTFNTQRYNDTSGVSYEFNPEDWTINEQSINDYLTNVTISTLSLDLGRNKTAVNVTEYRTIYEFSAPLNLIVPYALSYAIALAFVTIGIWSLHQNGVPAIDGGFLQVMSSTVGRTQMEDLVIASQRSGGKGGKNQDLLDMKIRYGELVDEGGEGTGVM
ncbi:hypothetical protein IQ07DRAFT_627422, partial [Pyrenochaeta sp. DS3sAY3a]